MIGNGFKWTYFGRLLITGDQAIPDALVCIDCTTFNLLTFLATLDGLMEFDVLSGEFTFKRRGLLDLSAALNIDTTTGNTEVEIITELDTGSGFVKLNARTAELQNIGQNQTVLEGKISQINKGDKIRFFVRSPNASASFKTRTLPDTSIVAAVVLHITLWTR